MNREKPQYQELSELFADREAFYRLMSSLFFKEVSEELIGTLEGLPAPVDDGSLFAQGWRELKFYLARKGPDARTDLAVDYARAFLAAGVLEGTAACPFESIYTGEEPLIMQEARDDVRALFISQGVNVDEALHLPEDHLSFELEFLAIMSDRAVEACAQEDEATLVQNITLQHTFLRDHILNWLPLLEENLIAVARQKFYPAVLRITEGYAQLDEELLADLLKEFDASDEASDDAHPHEK